MPLFVQFMFCAKWFHTNLTILFIVEGAVSDTGLPNASNNTVRNMPTYATRKRRLMEMVTGTFYHRDE